MTTAIPSAIGKDGRVVLHHAAMVVVVVQPPDTGAISATGVRCGGIGGNAVRPSSQTQARARVTLPRPLSGPIGTIRCFTWRCACNRDWQHVSILSVSSLIDGRPARAPVSADSTLSLTGRPLDARLPLALLEAVKAIDTPEAELDAELVHELRNKRLGLSDTVYQQIRRYSDAVRSRQRVGFDEVLALARLIGRRPDADLAFREAGRRWARSYVGTVGGLQRGAARSLPSLLGRPIALRLLRKLSRRYMDGVLVRQGSTVVLDVQSPVSADAAARAVGCGLYEAAFRESLLLLADAEGAIEHVSCRTRGDAHCQWRAEWRRR